MKYLSVFIFVFFANIFVQGQATVQLGELNEDQSWRYPITSNYQYMYTQSIYEEYEVMSSFEDNYSSDLTYITELSFVVKSDFVLEENLSFELDVYMKSISQNDDSFVDRFDFFDVTSNEKVYNGTIIIPNSDSIDTPDHWIKIVLDEPFIWDGVSNILVAWNELSQNITTDERVYFHTYKRPFNDQTLYYFNEDYPVDVNDLEYAYSSGAIHHNDCRDKPVVRFTFTDGSEQNTSGSDNNSTTDIDSVDVDITDIDSLGVDTLSVTNFSHFQGLAQFDGAVQMNGLTTVENPLQNSLLLINEDGFIERGGLDAIINAMYSPYPNQLQCYDGWRPTWGNDEEGNLFTTDLGSCQVKVGIGTDTPESRLHVIGDIRGNTLTLGRPANKPASLTIFRATNDPAGLSPLLNLGYYNATENQEYSALTFTAQGRLVIRSANEKILQLESDGLLRAREIKVDLDAWPDYVFEETYELMPLSEVQRFIQLNGHLPNVPAAIEVEDDGVNLGEAAKISMEKIEELTLYILQQQEQLVEQKRLIEEQRKLLEEQAKLIKLNGNR